MSKNTWLYVDIPLMAYDEARELQLEIVDAKRHATIDRNVILFLEHPSVFTLGRRGERSHLKVTEAFLESKGVPVVHVERGGDITYHGHGQLVVYPIITLRKESLGVKEFVTGLEEAMIRSAGDFGIRSERDPRNRGTWVGNNKLGSIGIAIRHGISFHGFAFNVSLAMEPFTWINPCGLQEIGMTSLEKELSRKVPMGEVREIVRSHMEDIFKVELESIDLRELRGQIKKGSVNSN
jgi:lipoate-protein ligase B